jgi:hypothetical protein
MQVYSPKSSYLDGFYKRLPENKNYESFQVFKKNTDEYLCFFTQMVTGDLVLEHQQQTALQGLLKKDYQRQV